MVQRNHLKGKKILLVDDEADVLETLGEELSACELSTATTFQEAKHLLECRQFDMAVLDIMGVGGYKLLDLANKKGVIAIMLTAHALSPENLFRSRKEGAASYVPKLKIREIPDVLAGILEDKGKDISVWERRHEKFSSYFDKLFGPNWNSCGEFWKEDFSVRCVEKYFH